MVWTHIHGTSDYNTSLFSAYQPCDSSTPGVNTVLAQHTIHLPAGSKEPREQFLLDLADAIRTRQDVGDIIMLGADLSQEVWHRHIHQYFLDLQMHNAITTRHPRLSPPATSHKNDSCIPINGIWCSIGIQPTAAGFFHYGDATPLQSHTYLGRLQPLGYWPNFVLTLPDCVHQTLGTLAATTSTPSPDWKKKKF
jgi:hypothetical protein